MDLHGDFPWVKKRTSHSKLYAAEGSGTVTIHFLFLTFFDGDFFLDALAALPVAGLLLPNAPSHPVAYLALVPTRKIVMVSSIAE
jgi:hypothetical protein